MDFVSLLINPSGETLLMLLLIIRGTLHTREVELLSRVD